MGSLHVNYSDEQRRIVESSKLFMVLAEAILPVSSPIRTHDST
jgi:hypothetical protein